MGPSDGVTGWRGNLTVAAAVAGIVAAIAAVVTVFLPPLLGGDDGGDPTSTTAETPPPPTTSTTGVDATPSSAGLEGLAGGPPLFAYTSRAAGPSQAFVRDVAEDRTTTMWGGRLATDPSVTPDGAIAAAIVEEQGRAVIGVGAPDSDAPRTFVVDGTPSDPEISPDGSSLAFVTNAGGDDDIAILDLDAGTTRIVVGGTADETDPSWSADGSRLVHVRTGSADDQIVVLAVDGSGAGGATLPVRGRARSPRLSADGEQVVYVGEVAGNRDALVRPLDGGDVTNLSQSPEQETGVVVVVDGRLVTAAPSRGLLLLDPGDDPSQTQLTPTPGDQL